MPAIPVPGRLRQDVHKFEASLDYIADYFKKKKES
jgi:hypothetical protein